MSDEFKLSKFEHWLLRKIRNGGLLSKHVSGNKYEYMGYDWDETGKYVNASVVARLEKAGFLREVDISEMGAHRPFRQYFQNTDLANKLNWQYQTHTMTYIVVSENEIVKAERERPDRNIYDENGNLFWTWEDYLLSLPRIAAPGHKWKLWQEVIENVHFRFGKECGLPVCTCEALDPCNDSQLIAIPIQPTPEATLPNCKYCGKFCNPKNEDVVTEDVYGFMGIDDTIFYHKKCKLQQITMENINNWGDVYNEFKRTKAYRLCLAKDLFQTFWQWLNKKYPKGITFPHNPQTP